MAAVGLHRHGEGGRNIRRRIFSLRQLHRNRFQVNHIHRAQHKKDQQEEHNINHRDNHSRGVFLLRTSRSFMFSSPYFSLQQRAEALLHIRNHVVHTVSEIGMCAQ